MTEDRCLGLSHGGLESLGGRLGRRARLDQSEPDRRGRHPVVHRHKMRTEGGLLHIVPDERRQVTNLAEFLGGLILGFLANRLQVELKLILEDELQQRPYTVSAKLWVGLVPKRHR